MRTLELGSLDQLLDFALESLDVPKELQARAKAVYDDLGARVMKHDAAAGRKISASRRVVAEAGAD